MRDSEFLLGKKGFGKYLVACNLLNEMGFEEWLFYPGMLFDSLEKWWEKRGQRPAPHEGTDFCLYKNKAGKECRLDETIRIPVMYDGKIVKIGKDFLGKSVYVSHDIRNGYGKQLYSIYGHTEPYSTIYKGCVLKEGDTFATISDSKKKKVDILSHLHITMAWIPESYPYERLNWTAIGERSGDITLLNPMEIIGWKYSVKENID